MVERTARLLTPPGRSAIASILVDGLSALSELEPFFQPFAGGEFGAASPDRIVFGTWTNSDGSCEELVVLPLSETQVEVHCHGGSAAPAACLKTLESTGFRVVHSDSKDSSRPPLSQRWEQRLSETLTLKTAGIVLNQMQGRMERAIEKWLAELESGNAQSVLNELQEVLRHEVAARHLTQPFDVVFAGLPNVGKSSLVNAILGFERSIVYDQPGTTRDIVTSETTIDGWRFQLSDTAGIRTATDQIESVGIQQATTRLNEADVRVFVVDGQALLDSENGDLEDNNLESRLQENLTKALQQIATAPTKASGDLIAINKIDLIPAPIQKQIQSLVEKWNQSENSHLACPIVLTDAHHQVGIDQLMRLIRVSALPVEPDSDQVLLVDDAEGERVKRIIELIRGNQNESAKDGLKELSL